MTVTIPYSGEASIQHWQEDSTAILDLRGALVSQAAFDALASELRRVKLAGATFVGSLNFETVQWPDALVDFTEVTFQGPAAFTGSVLGPTSRLNFDRNSFDEKVDFCGLDFGTRNSMFNRLTFHSDCGFHGATLAPLARFDHCIFHGTATMSAMTFGSDLTQFVDCVFHGTLIAHQTQLPSNSAVQFVRCSFLSEAQVSAPLGDGSVTVNECVPADALDSLVTPEGAGFFDPSTDMIIFFLNQGGHEFSVQNMAKLVYLFRQVLPSDALIVRRDAHGEFEFRVSVDSGTFSIADTAADAVAIDVPVNEEVAVLEQVHARRQLPNLTS